MKGEAKQCVMSKRYASLLFLMRRKLPYSFSLLLLYLLHNNLFFSFVLLLKILLVFIFIINIHCVCVWMKTSARRKKHKWWQLFYHLLLLLHDIIIIALLSYWIKCPDAILIICFCVCCLFSTKNSSYAINQMEFYVLEYMRCYSTSSAASFRSARVEGVLLRCCSIK